MVSVSGKPSTHRRAVATGTLATRADVVAAILAGSAPKGDVLAVARVAAIMGAKNAASLIPLAHPLPLRGVAVDISAAGSCVTVTAAVETEGPTGVEMEALTAVSAGLLTVYDMLKKADRGMTIGPIQLVEKTGGQSGTYRRTSGEGGHDG